MSHINNLGDTKMSQLNFNSNPKKPLAIIALIAQFGGVAGTLTGCASQLANVESNGEQLVQYLPVDMTGAFELSDEFKEHLHADKLWQEYAIARVEEQERELQQSKKDLKTQSENFSKKFKEIEIKGKKFLVINDKTETNNTKETTVEVSEVQGTIKLPPRPIAPANPFCAPRKVITLPRCQEMLMFNAVKNAQNGTPYECAPVHHSISDHPDWIAPSTTTVFRTIDARPECLAPFDVAHGQSIFGAIVWAAVETGKATTMGYYFIEMGQGVYQWGWAAAHGLLANKTDINMNNGSSSTSLTGPTNASVGNVSAVTGAIDIKNTAQGGAGGAGGTATGGTATATGGNSTSTAYGSTIANNPTFNNNPVVTVKDTVTTNVGTNPGGGGKNPADCGCDPVTGAKLSPATPITTLGGGVKPTTLDK